MALKPDLDDGIVIFNRHFFFKCESINNLKKTSASLLTVFACTCETWLLWENHVKAGDKRTCSHAL